MAQVKFISTEYLKEHTVIEQNVDDNKLIPFIIKVQDTYLQQALGTTFYNHLQDAVIGSSLTANEEVLLRTYVQPMVAEWTLYEVLPFLNYKPTNKAVSQENSENSNPSGLDEIKYLRNSVRDVAEFYSKRLTKYLCDFGNLFPSYLNPDANENLKASGKAYFNGFFIPGRTSISGIESYDDPSDNCDC